MFIGVNTDRMLICIDQFVVGLFSGCLCSVTLLINLKVISFQAHLSFKKMLALPILGLMPAGDRESPKGLPWHREWKHGWVLINKIRHSRPLNRVI